MGLPTTLIRDTTLLMQVLQAATWRDWPMVYDVPAATQIFGRIVQDAGLEGILYQSVLTGSACLAAFPQNLQNSSAYIEIDDSCPPETLTDGLIPRLSRILSEILSEKDLPRP